MTLLSTEFAPAPELVYPFGDRWHPPIGEPFEVADGVFWLRVPLPIALDHINLWLLRDGDGWTIVDTGMDDPICRDVWTKLFDTFMTPESVKRIIVTHFHPDHIGLAGWLAQTCDCKIWISQGEFDIYRYQLDRDQQQYYDSAKPFSVELGLSPEMQEYYLSFIDLIPDTDTIRVEKPLCHFMADGDVININGDDWQVVMGSGHSPEHACLYCPNKNVLISGDQALPRISSNVSVFIYNRHLNPLKNWLDSCAKLRSDIAHQTVILPSHQEPFVGLAERMQQLVADHEAQLNQLRNSAKEGFTALQAAQILFNRELSDFDRVFAVSETFAHIQYLLRSGELRETLNPRGALVFNRA